MTAVRKLRRRSRHGSAGRLRHAVQTSTRPAGDCALQMSSRRFDACEARRHRRRAVSKCASTFAAVSRDGPMARAALPPGRRYPSRSRVAREFASVDAERKEPERMSIQA